MPDKSAGPDNQDSHQACSRPVIVTSRSRVGQFLLKGIGEYLGHFTGLVFDHGITQFAHQAEFRIEEARECDTSPIRNESAWGLGVII